MKTVTNLTKTLRELKQMLNVRRDERNEFLSSLFKNYGLTITRGTDGQQIFLMPFQFDDSQKKLDNVFDVISKIEKKYKNDPYYIGVKYRYGGRKRYIGHVGPSTDELLRKVDGDLDYVLLRVRFKDPEY